MENKDGILFLTQSFLLPILGPHLDVSWSTPGSVQICTNLTNQSWRGLWDHIQCQGLKSFQFYAKQMPYRLGHYFPILLQCPATAISLNSTHLTLLFVPLVLLVPGGNISPWLLVLKCLNLLSLPPSLPPYLQACNKPFTFKSLYSNPHREFCCLPRSQCNPFAKLFQRAHFLAEAGKPHKSRVLIYEKQV